MKLPLHATLLLVALLNFFLVYDLLMAASLSTPWLAGVLGTGLLLGFFGTRAAPRKVRVGLLLGFVVGIGAIRAAEWNSRKPFLRDLYSVKPGMTQAEVEAIMGRYLHGTGWPAHPLSPTGTVVDAASGATHASTSTPRGELALAGSIVYRHTNEGWANSDWGIVRFENGRVSDVSFSPD
ncbi:hypothetical protein HPC49_01575 [Pyxidicoccus fallax]|uniref:Uncharacterized protein n=1 Tax=Pyxidicoccus fallax TaxID=394095 RepID=A0A848LC41_9BACT|nr:hypothetical protein [Pyxidicoccus fallax]NMO16044.1 hypothetical protein [Pyxidicoccus fallax]NPC76943.1 hypothetical protein [Pyxidicoccus fallax]